MFVQPGRVSAKSAGVLTCFVLLSFVAPIIQGCSDSPNVQAPVVARHGMVVSGHHLASEIGVDILKKGGNAVDAAVAVGFALAVVFPEAGNIGGGGFMVIRKPDGSSLCLDFREVAPWLSVPDMYLGRESLSVDGLLAAGVPGTVDGLLTALKEHGKLDRSSILQPSIDLAFRGVAVDSNLASHLNEYRTSLAVHASTRKIFFRGDLPLREGEILVQEDLGHTLERIRDLGREGFYGGVTASMIVSGMEREGGQMDSKDLSDYRSIVRPAMTGTYRGYGIISAGLPSSGGICLLKALQLLEPYRLGDAGFHTEESVHLQAEAMKRVFSMRATYLGDPAFVDVPVVGLLDAQSGRSGHFSMDTENAVPSDSLGGYPGVSGEGTETTHYSVIDRDGMAVAVTYTLNDLFGSKVVVEGGGFFLNDEMDDFVTVPGSGNMYGLVGGEENMVRPGKRPLSSMSPTIVERDGRPLLILGARGGSMIISAVLQVILNVIDYGMTPGMAVSEPRIHHQWRPDTLQYERGAITGETAAWLMGRGHHLLELNSTIGKVEAIYIEPGSGLYIGAPDPREGGSARGY